MFRGLKIRWINWCVNVLYAGTNSKYFEVKRKLLNSLGHEIDEETKIVGPVTCTGKLVVGKNCWLGKNLTVHGNGTVYIGDNCDLAPDILFQTGSHEIGKYERRAGSGFTKDIIIGDGCWIGVRSTILYDVKIGSGSVIAACSLVNKNVNGNTLVGGVPAKELRKLDND